MLHILTGPSGVGKTTILDKLHKIYGWRIVETYTTRPIRPTDVNKKFLNIGEFQTRQLEGYFYATQYVFQTYYGQRRSDIAETIADPNTSWVFDLAIDQVEPYKVLNPMIYLVMSLSKEQLINQLVSSGRIQRIEQSVQEYLNLVSRMDEFERAGVNIIYNFPNRIDEVCKKIATFRK